MDNKKEIIKFEDLFKEEIKARKIANDPDQKKRFSYVIIVYLLIMYIFATVVFLLASTIEKAYVTYTEEEQVLNAILDNSYGLTFMKEDIYERYESHYGDYLKVVNTQRTYDDYLIIVNSNNPYIHSFFYVQNELSNMLFFRTSSINDILDSDAQSLFWDNESNPIMIYAGMNQLFPDRSSTLNITLFDGPTTALSAFAISMVQLIVYILLFPLIVFLLKREIKIDLIALKTKEINIISSVALGYVLVLLGNGLSQFLSTQLSNAFKIVPQESANQQLIVSLLRSDGAFLIFLTAVFLGPIVEELIFRKAIFGLIKKEGLALIVSSFVFGAIHLIGENSIQEALVNGVAYFIMGGVFGYIYIRSQKNIIVPILVHVLSNLISVLAVIFIF